MQKMKIHAMLVARNANDSNSDIVSVLILARKIKITAGTREVFTILYIKFMSLLTVLGVVCDEDHVM